jgi:hypothetical protein
MTRNAGASISAASRLTCIAIVRIVAIESSDTVRRHVAQSSVARV